MIKYNIQHQKGSILRENAAYVGERIETKVARITNNNEPISDGAPIIYMERKDGIVPDYDIRTDRFDIAIEAMDKVAKTKISKRAEAVKPKENNELSSNTQGTEPGKPAA